ncbi:hypothetical protein [Enterobacter sp. kpr-6]|nr:hypothetical protein [Enterobacter sp. kpr-6]
MPQTDQKLEFFTVIAGKDFWILGIARTLNLWISLWVISYCL